ADGLLVAVGAGGVDVTVADLQRRAHRLVGLVVGGLPGAQAEQRDLDAGAQGDGRDRVLDRFIAHGSHSATRVSVAAVRGRGARATGAPGRLGAWTHRSSPRCPRTGTPRSRSSRTPTTWSTACPLPSPAGRRRARPSPTCSSRAARRAS